MKYLVPFCAGVQQALENPPGPYHRPPVMNHPVLYNSRGYSVDYRNCSRSQVGVVVSTQTQTLPLKVRQVNCEGTGRNLMITIIAQIPMHGRREDDCSKA